MRVMMGYRGEEILIKEYNSYYDLDSDMLCFTSKEDMVKSLGCDPEIDTIYILDKNDNVSPFNFDAIRAAHAYYSQRRGDEFTNWVYLSACSNRHNRTKLIAFFKDRKLDFTNGENPASINDVQNPEGKRLYDLTANIDNNLGIIERDQGPFRFYREIIVKDMKDYLRKDNKFDYYYMRKFIMKLASNYHYTFNEPLVKIPQLDIERRKKVIEELKLPFIENLSLSRKKKLDEMTNDREVIVTPIYDIAGDKIDELPYIGEEDNNNKKIVL